MLRRMGRGRVLVLGILAGLSLLALWGCTPLGLGPSGTPVAKIEASPTQGLVPLVVSFDGSDSYDPQGEITEWLWDFGDGSPVVSGKSVEHEYDSSGDYTVTLVVVGPSGTGRTAILIHALNNDPVASFSFYPEDPFQGEEVSFDGSPSSDPDGEIVSWEWDFGDGTTDEGQTVTHAFETPGEFVVTLTVTDDCGGTSSFSQTITVDECSSGHCHRCR